MRAFSRWLCWVLALGVIVGCGTAKKPAGDEAAAVNPPSGGPPSQAADPEPPRPTLPELLYLPSDTALFVHVDVAKIWDGSIGRTLRSADPKITGEVEQFFQETFGCTLGQIKRMAIFWPKLKDDKDPERFGVVLLFDAAYDKGKLQSGATKVFHDITRLAKPTLHTPSDRIAVVLVGLDNAYANSSDAAKTGPLASFVQEASSGKHTVVAAANLSQFPDEIRKDVIRPEQRPFQPMLRAETVAALVSLDKEYSVEVRVKTPSEAQAAEAEKGMRLLVQILQEAFSELPGQLLGKKPQDDPSVKNILVIYKAVQKAIETAKYTTGGTQTRVRAVLSNDLPLNPAVLETATKVREAAQRTTAENNLHQLSLSMLFYNDNLKGFPPGAVVDKKGKHLLSWRVLLLPYIEQNELFTKFKLDEPWDSPNNIKLLDQMPKTYKLPSPSKAKANETHYRVFVGKAAIFDQSAQKWEYGRSLRTDISDGPAKTVLIVTAAEPVPWTKPDELVFDPDKDLTPLLGFFANDECVMGFADGRARSIPRKKITRQSLKAMITPAGGEPVDLPDR